MTIFRTACASLSIVAAACTAAHGVTHGFLTWTAEDARRLEIAIHPVPVSDLPIEGAGISPTSMRAWLSRQGTPTIVDFGYTRCETVCAALGSVFQRLQGAILEDDPATPRVHLLTITFDPHHDDPDVLTRYAAGLHANPAVWNFVRTAPGEATGRLLNQFRVTVIADGMGGWEHNASLLVIDTTGRLVRVFDYDQMDRAYAFARSLPSTTTAAP